MTRIPAPSCPVTRFMEAYRAGKPHQRKRMREWFRATKPEGKRGNFNREDHRDPDELERQRKVLRAVGEAVGAFHGYEWGAICGPRKPKELAEVRSLAMALGAELSGASETETAKAFGRNHHNSVRHAKAVVLRMLATRVSRTREAARTALFNAGLL